MDKIKYAIVLIFLNAFALNSKAQETAIKDSLVKVYSDRAGDYFTKDSIPQAIIYINKAIELQPNSANLYVNRGLFYYFYPSHLDSALIDISHSIMLDSVVEKTHILRADIFTKMKRYSEAHLDLDFLVRKDSDNIDYRYYRALNYSHLNQYEKTIQDYLKIIDLDRKNMTASDKIVLVYNNLGYNYLQNGNYTKAKFYIDKAILEKPNLSFVWGSRGILNYKLGKLDQSLNDLNKAITIYESGKEDGLNFQPDLMYYYRGMIQMKQHQNIESCQSFTKALQLGNKDAKAKLSKVCNK